MTLPFRNVELVKLDAFVPVDNAVNFVSSLITATLLYGQYAAARNRKVLALASGYVFSALLLIPHTLAFPRALAPHETLGRYLQAVPWLYLARQAGIMVGFTSYALLRPLDDAAPASGRRVAISIVASVGSAVAVATLVSWFTIAKQDLLPPIMHDPVRTTTTYETVIVPAVIALSFIGLIVFRRARTSILDLWVQVATISWLLQLWLLPFVTARFSLVFYSARSMGMVSSSVVLMALVAESMMLHRKVALSLASRDQERAGRRTAMDMMVGAIVHELRQPLAAIMWNGKAGERMLKTVPGSDEARTVFEDIGSSAHHAGEILDSVRSLFAPSPNDQGVVDANDVVRHAVKATRIDLEARDIAIHMDLEADLPAIHGHRGQLLQVIVNGLTNAMDALTSTTGRPCEIDIRTVRSSYNGISILIEDSGDGIDDRVKDRIFDPFESTKATGMGLGLSISRSIIEAHGGTLSLTNGPVHGAVFRVDLPRESRVDATSLRILWKASGDDLPASEFSQTNDAKKSTSAR